MWNHIAGTAGRKSGYPKQTHATTSECSDNESSSLVSRDEGLECQICCDSFNIVENVPYVLWCGHTLCKSCILGLQCAATKFHSLPAQLPLLISCPWCNILSLRLVYKGNLMFPRKNYFLLGMVESMNCNRPESLYPLCEGRQPEGPSNHGRGQSLHHSESSGSSHNRTHHAGDFDTPYFLWKLMVLFINISTKFPLVILFLLIVFYVIPASAVILVLYILITVLFALPSFLILYFAYPSLVWIVKEIIS